MLNLEKMQHVSAAEVAFCLLNGCLRQNDFLRTQGKVQYNAFPAMGIQMIAPQLLSPIRGHTSGFWQGGSWRPTERANRVITRTRDLYVISAMPSVMALHPPIMPKPWRALLSLLDEFLSLQLLTHCLWFVVGISNRRVLEEKSTEMFGFDGVGMERR